MANERRLIDANALLEELERYINAPHVKFGSSYSGGIRNAIANCISFLKEQPTVEAVEVVRCRDCKHYDNREGIQWCHLNSKFAQWGMDWHSFPEDGYCSYGERKDNEKG